jgi:hypothetical protein
MQVLEQLNEEERAIASAVIAVVGADKDFEGAFRSPGEWNDDYGRGSELILVHDGGPLAPYCSYDYQDYGCIEELSAALSKIGCYVEQCTSWYSAVYKS